ncbi:MAG: insulinase family protein [Bacteroidales bacterium]|nr:insulinase family protein [Bacteroidales bacterium]MCF6342754.1 insulinase family protein [Bacteroidales bacterium]
MDYHYHILNNGIKLIHRQLQGSVSHCGLMVDTGSRDESDRESGLAHFIEHLIFKGTEKRKAYHVLSRIENLGGDLNAFTSKEETCIYASFLSPYYAQSLELFADVAFSSVFPRKEIEKEKEVVVDEINSYNDSPAEMIFDDFESRIFDGHPLARNILGSIAQVEQFKKQDILRFVKRNYSTRQMVIASVGNIHFNKLIRLAEKYFGHIKPTEKKDRRVPFTQYKKTEKRINKESYLSHCIMGNIAYPASHPNKLSLLLLSNLLGGPALNSRLNLAIREKHGYAYAIESAFQPYSDTGVFSIYFGADKKQLGKVIQLVSRELRKLMDKPLGTIQLHRARQQIKGQLAIHFESPLNEMLSMAKNHLHNTKLRPVKELIEKIDTISGKKVLETANEIFIPENLSLLIYKGK